MAKDIGILAADIYFPQRFVSQEALEQHDGVAVGKYTLGLGQQSMAFCDETEDINSICMNAVEGLLRRFGVSPREVGRLEVGTETTVDKSKSVKSTLMPIFAEHGNTDVEGIDTTNACYGGTNALFNSLAWMESSAWDGRYAVVVAADIAVYEKGPARPTGGAGAVALLIGPNAPIVFDRRLRGSHFEHAWDFYKPHMASEYPCVDGHLSNTCYLRALDSCYARYADKFAARGGAPLDVSADFQHALFHQPYFKLVQKSFARLMFAQARKYPELASTAALAPFAGMDAEVSYSDKELAKTASQVAAPLIERVVEPGTTVGRRLGNLYCGSLYAAVLSLITYGCVGVGHNRAHCLASPLCAHGHHHHRRRRLCHPFRPDPPSRATASFFSPTAPASRPPCSRPPSPPQWTRCATRSTWHAGLMLAPRRPPRSSRTP